MSLLRRVSLFDSLTEKQLKALESQGVLHSYPKNSIIINESDPPGSLYVVKTGKVKVFLTNEDGRELVANVHGPGEYFGELSLLDGHPRSASVMTVQPTTLLIIFREKFLQFLSENPATALGLVGDLVSRVRELTEKVRSLAHNDVYKRITKTLEDLATPVNGKLCISEKITQRDLANRIGASREMVARILKNLSRGGYITVNQKAIILNGKLPANY